MNVTPIIVGRKSTDEAVVCDNEDQACTYITDLIEEGEDESDIVVYRGQMINVNITLKRTATVHIGGKKQT